MAAPASLSVVLLNRQRARPVSAPRLRRVLRGAARSLGVGGELSLVMAGDGMLRRLNRVYRGKDKTTDVLSFPGEGGEAGLGDIVISVESAVAKPAPYLKSTVKVAPDACATLRLARMPVAVNA